MQLSGRSTLWVLSKHLRLKTFHVCTQIIQKYLPFIDDRLVPPACQYLMCQHAAHIVRAAMEISYRCTTRQADVLALREM